MSEKQSRGGQMSIMVNQNGDIFEQFIPLDETKLDTIQLDAPLTHALVVAKHQGKYLLIFNTWRKNWELAGGIIDDGESPRECAVRELLEESNQSPSEIGFKGLMKFHLKNGRVEYGALYAADIAEVKLFAKNDEADQMIFWDLETDIGYINEIDRKLLEFY